MSIDKKLAEMMYLDGRIDGEATPEFSTISEKSKEKYLNTATRALKCLDKLNFSVVRTDTIETETQKNLRRSKLSDTFEAIIKDHLSKINHPRNMKEYFPAREMAEKLAKEV